MEPLFFLFYETGVFLVTIVLSVEKFSRRNACALHFYVTLWRYKKHTSHNDVKIIPALRIFSTDRILVTKITNITMYIYFIKNVFRGKTPFISAKETFHLKNHKN